MITYRQPFKGTWPISQEYGVVIPGVTYKGRPHSGIDYACPKGTPILASGDGVVAYSDFDSSGYGHLIEIQHPDGKSTFYAHLSERHVIKGAQVKQGDVIGLSGNTGNSTGPHLHFEARKERLNWRSHQNPVTFLPMMTVDDSIIQNTQQSNNVNTVQQPSYGYPSVLYGTTAGVSQKNEQKIDGGLCEVICDEANLRDAENYLVCGRLLKGAKVVVSPDVVMFNNLPYHKICDDYMLIAEYDGFGTDILRQIDC
ncbi:MAG: M23 family metallopeptidase [Flexilinea sp.]|nr:M23 family metallopeptidase [Flexilinea sp.]